MARYAPYVRKPHERSLATAETLLGLPKLINPASAVAAWSPTTQQAQANVVNAAQLFGMAPQNSSALLKSHIPDQYLRQDRMGYSSAPLAFGALANIKQNQPNAFRKYQSLFDQPSSDDIDGLWGSGWKTGATPQNAQYAYNPYNFFQALQTLKNQTAGG